MQLGWLLLHGQRRVKHGVIREMIYLRMSYQKFFDVFIKCCQLEKESCKVFSLTSLENKQLREECIDILSNAFSLHGLNRESEPTEFGLEIDDAISYLLSFDQEF